MVSACFVYSLISFCLWELQRRSKCILDTLSPPTCNSCSTNYVGGAAIDVVTCVQAAGSGAGEKMGFTSPALSLLGVYKYPNEEEQLAARPEIP